MPRALQPITIADLSAFTKNLRQDLQKRDDLPGHAAMLSMVAKAAGYQNYQHLRADQSPATAQTQTKQLDRALRVFEGGIMTRWPKQTSVQALCMWAFWAALPARTDLGEKDVNEILRAGHSFEDHALLRRSLIDHKLVTRTKDGKTYRRIERAPPSDAKALIKAAQRPS
ncbi:DUF2087 domain-containing protein [Yoonia sp. BS5-3]|uniref:DUF2087 domain-containing protein n=1 Tax=Yoonia phaeophyticola TaxID=3137369 RepID=A0ABZ2UZX0_9RHOB